MKHLVNTFTVLLLLITGTVATSANYEIKKKYVPTVKDLEGLSEKLIELESNELSTINDIKDYIKQVENLAETYHQGTISKSKEKKALEVLYDMEKYAEETKASGSTRDMMECGFLHSAAFHYKTALNSKELLGQIDLPVVNAVTNEIEAWLKLENTLNEYYAYSSFLHNQGGSMAGIAASGSAWRLAEARYNDTEQLLKAGFARGARDFPMQNDIKKKANDIVNSFTTTAKDLLDCDKDFKKSAYYKEVSKSMTEACQNLKTVMDTWVNKRLAMIACFEEQGIGISETFKLLDNIKKIGELEK